MSKHENLGADLRALRKSRELSLEALSTQLDKSIGWLSQVERNLSIPDTQTLKKMAVIFDVPMSLFFGAAHGPEIENGRIVRAKSRRELGERNSGLVESLLSPDLTDSFEVLHSTFMPGAERKTASVRPTQELAYLVSGQLNIWLNDTFFTVRSGDSFRVRNQSLKWANPYKVPAVAIWVISPPVY